MKITLTEEGLTVGKHKCHDITIIRFVNGIHTASMYNVKGWTYKKKVMTRLGEKTVTIRLTKKLRFKIFEYAGIPLVEGFSFPSNRYEKCLHATNQRGEYVNYYEQKEVT